MRSKWSDPNFVSILWFFSSNIWSFSLFFLFSTFWYTLLFCIWYFFPSLCRFLHPLFAWFSFFSSDTMMCDLLLWGYAVKWLLSLSSPSSARSLKSYVWGKLRHKWWRVETGHMEHVNQLHRSIHCWKSNSLLNIGYIFFLLCWVLVAIVWNNWIQVLILLN